MLRHCNLMIMYLYSKSVIYLSECKEKWKQCPSGNTMGNGAIFRIKGHYFGAPCQKGTVFRNGAHLTVLSFSSLSSKKDYFGAPVAPFFNKKRLETLQKNGNSALLHCYVISSTWQCYCLFLHKLWSNKLAQELITYRFPFLIPH